MGFPRTTPLHPEQDSLHRRIFLVGKTGVGKSATGNTILGENKFKSALGSSSVTLKCELHQAVISGKNITVIDTPGLFDTKIRSEELKMEIGSSIYLSRPGPHAFLYVQPVNIRFTKQDDKVFPKLGIIFGQEMKKYTMILFTYGDLLEKESVEELIQKNNSLYNLVAECGGYHVFNNKQLGHREQVSELLEKIDRMVEKNGGTCYSNQMYEEAMSLRQEEEEQVRKEMEERERREETESLRKAVKKKEREEREETERLWESVEEIEREWKEETERLWEAVEKRDRERREETERLWEVVEETERLKREIRAGHMEMFNLRNSSYLHYSSGFAGEEQSGLGFKWVVGIGLLICAAGLIITKVTGFHLPKISLVVKKILHIFRL